MNIEIPFVHLQALAPNLVPDHYKGRKLADYGGSLINVNDAHKLEMPVLEKFKEVLTADWEQKRFPGHCSRLNEIKKILRYRSQPKAATRFVTDLDDLELSLKDVVHETSPDRHWLYREMEDGQFCPAYVARIWKKEGRRDDPPRVYVEMIYMHRQETKTLTASFYRSDISGRMADDDDGGEISGEFSNDVDPDEDEPKKKVGKKVKRSIADILKAKKLVLETEQLFTEYKAAIPDYIKHKDNCGRVIQASGAGYYASITQTWRDEESYSISVKDCAEDGVEIDLVLDDSNAEKIEFSTTYSWWSYGRDGDSYEVPAFWEKKSYSIPFHPYLLTYDLRRHSHVWVHSSIVSDRAYEEGVLDKLVLSPVDKSFLTMLMNSAGAKMEDIVKGKAGGIFILSEGMPGTGKTLTAEIYSEAMKRALYTVQCAQLGINPEDIEKRLGKVLKRAQRWGAVLLLDEADVYIRARDTDVQHNAIVGVMLRVIEYYNGLLFMTTNLDNIDDAIRSRATAHVIYTAPGIEKLTQIWKVLSKQFGLELSGKDIEKLAEKWPKAVGRDVKNLIKLARLASVANKEKPSAETVIMVSNYLDMKGKEAK